MTRNCESWIVNWLIDQFFWDAVKGKNGENYENIFFWYNEKFNTRFLITEKLILNLVHGY